MQTPIHIPEYFIYDINYTDSNEYLIVTPKYTEYTIAMHFKNYYPRQFKMIQSNNAHKYGSNDQSLYVLEHDEYFNEIELSIDGKVITANVNRYPTYENEIIMSTLVLNEDKYICQWINYHKMFGITRFIIYDNYHPDKNLLKLNNKDYQSQTDLSKVLHDYIADGTVLLIKWEYPYSPCAQQTQQNHSIHTFKKCKYIGLFDVDEYLNGPLNLHTLFDDLLQQIECSYDDIGSFRLLSRPMINPKNKPEHDYEFLRITECLDFCQNAYEKNFVVPRNVNIFSVHMIIDGKPMINIPISVMYFNHYLYLNKINRGRNIASYKSDDSILRFLDLMPVINMIPKGGFGNVLFIYIAGYALKKKYNRKLTFADVTQGQRPRMKTYPIFKHCVYSSLTGKILNEPQFMYTPISLPNEDVVLNGYYQSWKYSDGYISEIKQELWANIPEQYAKVKAYYDNIKCQDNVINVETVLLHVRRTDYLTASDFHSNLTDQYYLNALKHFDPEKIKLIVFSDDVPYIQNWSVIKPYSHHIVELVESVDTFLLMTMCDHYIIANSSLSLAAYYFRDNVDAMLCIPQRWFEPKKHKYSHDDLVKITDKVHIVDENKN
jgi:hypothetical protein